MHRTDWTSSRFFYARNPGTLIRMKIIYWLPRILSIGFVLFLSVFSLDIFSEYRSWNAVIPLLIHLIPTFVLLAVFAISWKRDLVGAGFFLGFAILYIFSIGFDRPWSWYAGISGPMAITGLLFLWNWFWNKKASEYRLL